MQAYGCKHGASMLSCQSTSHSIQRQTLPYQLPACDTLQGRPIASACQSEWEARRHRRFSSRLPCTASGVEFANDTSEEDIRKFERIAKNLVAKLPDVQDAELQQGELEDGLLPFGTSADKAADIQANRQKTHKAANNDAEGFATLDSKRTPKQLPNEALPKVAIVGRPNVGKSCLFNRIAGASLAVVYDEPGVTRDRLYTRAQWGSTDFVLVDTGGLMSSADHLPAEQRDMALRSVSVAALPSAIERQAAAGVAEADAVVLLVDGRVGVQTGDREVLAWLRQNHPDKPVVLAVNKCDNAGTADLAASEFWELGIEPYPISAINGSGTGDLLDALMKELPPPKDVPAEVPDTPLSIAIVGRPNVGLRHGPGTRGNCQYQHLASKRIEQNTHMRSSLVVQAAVNQSTLLATSPATQMQEETQHDSDVLIEFKDVYKSFGDKRILNGASFKIRRGEAVGIIGASGTGKSTTLRIAAGLLAPDRGEVLIMGKPRKGLLSDQSDDEGLRIGMAFQNAALFDSLTVGENVGFLLYEHSNLEESRIRELVAESLAKVGLPGAEGLYPSELSGGMKKRVALARAVVQDVRAAHEQVIMYDEPTAGLDPVASTVVEDLMRSLHNSSKPNMNGASRSGISSYIVVTHQHSTIRRAVDRIIFLHKGKVVWQGSVKEFDTTSEPIVRQFAEGTLNGPIQYL